MGCGGEGVEHWLEVQLAAVCDVSHVKLFWHFERFSPVSKARCDPFGPSFARWRSVRMSAAR